MRKTISPIDNQVVYEKPLHTQQEVHDTMTQAKVAQKDWQAMPLSSRQSILRAFLEALKGEKEAMVKGLVEEMGRPIQYAAGELNGTLERAEYMIEIAGKVLADEVIPSADQTKRIISKVAVGIAFLVPAWNYPYLTAINGLVPALLAGNAVLFKGSSQTPTAGEVFARALQKAGLPSHIFTNLLLDHQTTHLIAADPRVQFLGFTGSVDAGRSLALSANDPTKASALSGLPAVGFTATVLELGGKDAAYVRSDANVESAAAELASGSFFNSGQCCCAIERVYVHQDCYDRFVETVVRIALEHVVGDPKDPRTTMGPMAKGSHAADDVRAKVEKAIQQGATHLTAASTQCEGLNGNYVQPYVLACPQDPSLSILQEETFGPVMPIVKVEDDETAISLMNQSDYGLTASIWTADIEKGHQLGQLVEAGTVFTNRCDYLDPRLPWCSQKDSGIGCTLSSHGYAQLTRLKSYLLQPE